MVVRMSLTCSRAVENLQRSKRFSVKIVEPIQFSFFPGVLLPKAPRRIRRPVKLIRMTTWSATHHVGSESKNDLGSKVGNRECIVTVGHRLDGRNERAGERLSLSLSGTLASFPSRGRRPVPFLSLGKSPISRTVHTVSFVEH